MAPSQAHPALGLALIALFAAVSASPDAPTVAAAAAAPGAFDCARGCTFTVQPVCGADGEWYHNECVAACSGNVNTADASVCSGECAGRGRRVVGRRRWGAAQPSHLGGRRQTALDCTSPYGPRMTLACASCLACRQTPAAPNPTA
jgi:hypothetical protein